MSMFNKISKYEADMEDSVVSFNSSSLGYIESTYEWKLLLLIDKPSLIYRQYIEMLNKRSPLEISSFHVVAFE